mgnify:CR=1 FL=1
MRLKNKIALITGSSQGIRSTTTPGSRQVALTLRPILGITLCS